MISFYWNFQPIQIPKNKKYIYKKKKNYVKTNEP